MSGAGQRHSEAAELRIILDRSIPKEEAKQRAVRHSTEHKTQKSVLMTLAGAANSRIDYHAFEKGAGDMGEEFGLTDSDILARLQTKPSLQPVAKNASLSWS